MTSIFKIALDDLNKVECGITALDWFEKHSGSAKSTVAQALTLATEAEQIRKERDELAGVMKYIYTQAKANHPQALTVIAMNAGRFVNDKKDT